MASKKELFEDEAGAPPVQKATTKPVTSGHHHRLSDHETLYDPYCPQCRAEDEARKGKQTMTKEEFERTLFMVPRDNPETQICSDYIASIYPPKDFGDALCKSHVRYDKLGAHRDLQIVMVRRVHDDFGCLPSAFREIPNTNPGQPPNLRPRPNKELFPECLESAPVKIVDYMDFRVTSLYGRENDKAGPHRLAQALQDIVGHHYHIIVPTVYTINDQKIIYRCG